MAIQQLAIPTDESGFKVELAYLERWSPESPDDTPLAFLVRSDASRSGASPWAEAYRQNLPGYTRDFGEMLGDRSYELVVSPPSSRRDLDPYREAVVSRGIARTDLTDFVRRSRDASARSQSFDELVGALSLTGAPPVDSARSLLIVDDYFVTGRTAAALLSVLRSHGFPADGGVTVACPLWLGGREHD